MRAVQNLLVLDFLVQQGQVRGLAECLTVEIPDLDDAEPLLRANRHTHNLIRRVHGTLTQGRGGQIALEDLDSVLSGDLQAVRTAADVDLVLPQR